MLGSNDVEHLFEGYLFWYLAAVKVDNMGYPKMPFVMNVCFSVCIFFFDDHGIYLWYSQWIPGNDRRFSPARLSAVHNSCLSRDVSRQALKTAIFVHFFNPPLNQIRSFKAAKVSFTFLKQSDIPLSRIRCFQGMWICRPASVCGHTQILMFRGKVNHEQLDYFSWLIARPTNFHPIDRHHTEYFSKVDFLSDSRPHV